MDENNVIWNSLEISKFIVSIVTPLTLLFLGIWINKRLKKFEQIQWANQKLIEKRLHIYEQLVPLLNDILCYFTFIGVWKEYEPKKVVELKRKVDKIAYVYAPLFSTKFLTKYNKFIELCYSTYSGWGCDAKLKTLFLRRKDSSPNWDMNWEIYFVDKEEISEPEQIKIAYKEFVQFLSEEIGIGLIKESINTGMVPYNIK